MTRQKPLTSADIKRMSYDEIIEYWRQRQIADRDAGRPYYTTLIDPVTDEIAARID